MEEVCDKKMIVFQDQDFKQRKGYYMDKTLTENLDILKKAVKKKWDGVVMVDGIEGVAKTTLTSAMAYYLDPTYNLDRVVFTQEQFFLTVDKTKPGQAIHWDEFIMGGLSTEAMTKSQNALMKKMTTIRKKRLYIILVVPYFFMMRPYFAVGRSRFLLHCYTPDGITRGHFSFYSYGNKKKMYYYGKKEMNYIGKPDFRGRFTDTFGFFWNERDYDTKKDKAIYEITGGDNAISGRELMRQKRIDKIATNLDGHHCPRCEHKYTRPEQAGIFGLTVPALMMKIKEAQNNAATDYSKYK